jgi:hypothetical protein
MVIESVVEIAARGNFLLTEARPNDLPQPGGAKMTFDVSWR